MTNKFNNQLNDCIQSSSSNDLETSKTKKRGYSLKFKEHDINGVRYQIPATSRATQYYFISLTLSYNENQIETDSKINSLIEPESANQYSLYIELYDLSYITPNYKSKGIVAALYRKGEKAPISIAPINNDTTDEQILLYSSNQPIEPGEYFILISNTEIFFNESPHLGNIAHSSYFFFRILHHGSKLKHPELKDVFFSSDKILTLQMKQEIVEERDRFSIYGYSSNGKIMTMNELISNSSNDQGKIEIKVELKEWWLNDRYTFVILHNNEPYSHFSFDWQDGKVLGRPVIKKLKKDTPLYMMAIQTRTNTYWPQLASLPGYSEIKSGILNLFCKKMEKQPLRCAISTEKPFQENLISPIVSVMNPDSMITDYHCEELINDLEEDFAYPTFSNNRIICLHHLSLLSTEKGAQLLSDIEKAIQNHKVEMGLILYGTAVELERLFAASPILAKFIPTQYRWKTQPYTLLEQINEFRELIKNEQLIFSHDAQETVIRLMTEKKEVIKDWEETEIAAWIEYGILPCFRQRVIDSRYWAANKAYFTTLEAEDIQFSIADINTNAFENSMKELNEMVGLSTLKNSLTTIFNRVRFEEKRKLFGLSIPEKNGYHMIFTGNPGTGKTTVAKLIGRIFHSLGLLSKGKVIETERSKLVGEYIGMTELKTKEVLEEAKGNVLFIDEAYNLCINDTDDHKDFGYRVLECILTALSQKNPDMIVIMAGYDKEMEQLLEWNPGFKGRFPYKFHFDDYNAEELYQIACNLLIRADYLMTPEADTLLKETIQDSVAHKNKFFHNARWIEQYILDGVISAMSDRVMSMPLITESQKLFQTIEVEDIHIAYQKMKPQLSTIVTQNRRIGFVA